MLVADSREQPWSVVTDVHGAAGVSGWKQLVPGSTLAGPWEAIEVARIPPGGVSGRHRHTRTNELYFVLSGRAEYLVDGRAEPMAPGHLAVIAVGSVHGLRNVGADEVVWLVAEAPARLAEQPSSGEAMVHRSSGPLDLDRIGELDLLPYGVEPLRRAGVRCLEAGTRWDVAADRDEFFGYLIEGSGTVCAGGVEVPVAACTGITLTRGEHATLTAIDDARVFWVRSALPDDGP